MSRKDINHKKQFKKGIFTSLLILSIFILFASFSFQIFAQCEVGSPAPGFALQSPDGETYQLSQYKNQQDFIVLSFLKNDDSGTPGILQKLIDFFKDPKPLESFKIVAILVSEPGEEINKQIISIQEQADIPLILLIDDNGEVPESYQIDGFPTMVLLRDNLCVTKVYSKFTDRQERMFYQYLKFIFSYPAQDGSSGCDNGVCPPPPGY